MESNLLVMACVPRFLHLSGSFFFFVRGMSNRKTKLCLTVHAREICIAVAEACNVDRKSMRQPELGSHV